MNTCPNCGKVAGIHSSILQGCMCQYSMQAPPQRTWVGLTDEETDLLEELYAPPVHPDFVNDADHCLELIRHVEAKLKDKNGYAEERNT